MQQIVLLLLLLFNTSPCAVAGVQIIIQVPDSQLPSNPLTAQPQHYTSQDAWNCCCSEGPWHTRFKL